MLTAITLSRYVQVSDTEVGPWTRYVLIKSIQDWKEFTMILYLSWNYEDVVRQGLGVIVEEVQLPIASEEHAPPFVAWRLRHAKRGLRRSCRGKITIIKVYTYASTSSHHHLRQCRQNSLKRTSLCCYFYLSFCLIKFQWTVAEAQGSMSIKVGGSRNDQRSSKFIEHHCNCRRSKAPWLWH